MKSILTDNLRRTFLTSVYQTLPHGLRISLTWLPIHTVYLEYLVLNVILIEIFRVTIFLQNTRHTFFLFSHSDKTNY